VSADGVTKGSGAAGQIAASPKRERLAWAARLILPCLGLAFYSVSLAFMPHEMFLWVFDSELGPVELGTAACWFAASVLAFWLAVRSRGRAPAAIRALYVLFALGALFAGLEEISYGQHFFGWQSPRWFVEENAQHETNLHNLYGDKPGKALRNLALAGVTAGGIVLPALAMWTRGAYSPGRFAYYLLPRGELIPLVAVALLMRLFRTLPHGLRAGRDMALFELLELYLSITALMYILIVRRRLLSVDTLRDGGA
jgi:hypothetical protein